MFTVKDVSVEEIKKSILRCQENENPFIRVIDSNGLFIEPLPPRIKLDKEIEWIESGRKSPTAWRLNVDDELHFVYKKSRK